MSFDKFWKILADLEVLRGVVSERDQLEFTIRNMSEKFCVERILLLSFFSLRSSLVNLGSSSTKFASRMLATAFPLSSAGLLGWETELWALFA